MMKLRKIVDPELRAAVRNLKRGIIPPPPVPRKLTTQEEQWWLQELKVERRRLEAEVKRHANDPSRLGHKRRLRLDEQIVQINKALKK